MKVRRAAAFAAALCMVCTVLPIQGAAEGETAAVTEDVTPEEVTGLTYEAAVDHVVITGCDKTLAALEIPAQIGGLPVTQIANSAFSRSEAASITIPDSVQVIGSGAFWHCHNLTSVTIPEGVERLEGYLFNDCTALTQIGIPESVSYIGTYVFTDSAWLAARQEEDPFVVVNGILADASAAVVSPENPGVDPVEIVLPDGITGIAEQVFGRDGYMVTSVYIPDGVRMIAKKAFYRYGILSEVRLPDTLTEIGEDAFTGTKWFDTLKSESEDYLVISGILLGTNVTEGVATIPEDVWNISSGVFVEHSDITQVILPEGLRVIGSKAFLDCTGLTEIVLPESMEVIGQDAFSGCLGLTYVTIPGKMKRLEKGAFLNCDNMTGARVYARDLQYGENAIGCQAKLQATGQYAYLMTTIINHDFELTCLQGSSTQAYAAAQEMQCEIFRLYALGDVDANGTVNANDASGVLIDAARRGAKLESMLDTDRSIAADVNEDQAVNAIDASYILQYAANVGASRIPKGTPMEEFLHPSAE